MFYGGNEIRDLFAEKVHGVFGEVKCSFAPQLESYLVDLLVHFSPADAVYRISDVEGRPIRTIDAFLYDADPVRGNAPSFDYERKRRKYLGDLILFCMGFLPERRRKVPFLHGEPEGRLYNIAEESYEIVSAFDVFEYENEAPLFRTLAQNFSGMKYGLSLVKDSFGREMRSGSGPPWRSH